MRKIPALENYKKILDKEINDITKEKNRIDKMISDIGSFYELIKSDKRVDTEYESADQSLHIAFKPDKPIRVYDDINKMSANMLEAIENIVKLGDIKNISPAFKDGTGVGMFAEINNKDWVISVFATTKTPIKTIYFMDPEYSSFDKDVTRDKIFRKSKKAKTP